MIRTATDAIPEYLGDLSFIYKADLTSNSWPCLFKVENLGLPPRNEAGEFQPSLNPKNLCNIINNNITTLEYFQERTKEAREKGDIAEAEAIEKNILLGYVGSCEHQDRVGIVFTEFDEENYHTLDDLLETTTSIRNITNELFDKSANLQPKELEERKKNVMKKLKAGNTLPVSRALKIYQHLLDRVDLLHRHGVLHYDIWPKNIMVGKMGMAKEDGVLLIDLALTRRMGTDPKALLNGMNVTGSGGIYYSMSSNKIFTNLIFRPPEFNEDLPQGYIANETSDIYNLCNVFCLMLTGRLIEFYKAKWDEDPNKEGRLEDYVKNLLVKEILEKEENKNPNNEYRKYLYGLADIIVRGTGDYKKERYKNILSIKEDLEKLLEPAYSVSSASHTASTSPSSTAPPPTAGKKVPPSPAPQRKSAPSQPLETAAAPSPPPAVAPQPILSPPPAPAPALVAEPAKAYAPSAASASSPPETPAAPIFSSEEVACATGLSVAATASRRAVSGTAEASTSPPPISTTPLRLDFARLTHLADQYVSSIRTAWERWKRAHPEPSTPADSSPAPVVEEAAKAASPAYTPSLPPVEINLVPREMYAPIKSRAPWKKSTRVALAAGAALALGSLGLGTYTAWRWHQGPPTITILRPAAADNSSLEAALQGYSPQIQEQAQKVEQSLGPDGKKILVDLLQQKNYQGPEALSIAGELAEIALKKDSRQFIERANQYKSGNNLK